MRRTTMLKVEHLTKNRGKFALEDINFQLEPGYIMGLIGPNGSGKSTLIQLLMNLIKEDSGTIKIFGKDHRKFEKEIKQDIGFVYDKCYYPMALTIMETAHFLAPYYKRWDWGEFQRLMEIMELSPNDKLDQLSKGNLTKAMIIFACCHHAKLIVMDEPTAGLDPIVRRELLQVFQEILGDGEASLLYSTHITTDLDKIADYISFVMNGKLIFSQSQETLKENHKLLHLKGSELGALEGLDLVGFERNDQGITALVRGEIREGLGTCEQPNLEDMMYYYKKGDLHD